MYALKEKVPKSDRHSDELTAIIKRLGSPVSNILLNSPYSIFNIPKIDGIVGYQQIGKCAVVIGDPICWPDKRGELYKAFQLYCHEHGLRIIHILASKSFAYWAVKNGCRTLIQAGEELIIDPLHFQKRQKLRWKINQALQHGVEIKEYKHKDLALESEMQKVIATWLEEKKSPQIHLGHLDSFITSRDRRIFYAMREGKIVGLLGVLPINRFKGWVLTSFCSISQAPAGTTEHLMSTIIDILAQEKCRFFCLGGSSGEHLGEIIGLNFFFKCCAHLVFKISKWFFKLDAKRIHLNKYLPDHNPLYFLLNGKLTITELMAIKKILNVKL